jgi:YidC/Oxa1 family membrane protein insertase
MLIVMIPLMIAAGVFTHITARHSVARQTEAQAANPQAAIMNKMMLYVFPIGVVVGAPFLPLAVLIYWVANNLWTLGQQYVVYKKIDAEEAEKKTQAVAERQARAPRPGQKPVRPEVARPEAAPEKTPGAKPVARRTAAGSASDGAGNGEAKRTEVKGVGANGAGTDGSGVNGAGTSRPGAGGSTRPPARRPRKRR